MSTLTKKQSKPLPQKPTPNGQPEKRKPGRPKKHPLPAAAPLPAPTPAAAVAGDTITRIDLADIEAGTMNPRKHFNEQALADLAASIATQGIIQPLVVRPWPLLDLGREPKGTRVAKYQIVCGERRWRAARKAGLKDVPCIIRERNDQQVLEIMVVENEQREDVNVLEKCDGYHGLAKFGMTVEQIATRVGQSASTVRAVMKLKRLPPAAKDAVAAGTMSYSIAQLIASLPGELARIDLASWALKADWRDNLPSVRNVKEEIQKTYMVELKQAPFDLGDKTLWNTAGSCKECPKRAGNNREEWPDARADVCTDPACYRSKVGFAKGRLYAAAKAKGLKAISGDEADTADRKGIGQWGISSWIGLAEQWCGDQGGRLTVEQRLKGRLDRERVYGITTAGVELHLVPRKEAEKLLKGEDLEQAAQRRQAEASGSSRQPTDGQVAERARRLGLLAIADRARDESAKLRSPMMEENKHLAGVWQMLRLATWAVAIDELDARDGLDVLPRFIPRLAELDNWQEQLTELQNWTAAAPASALLSCLLQMVASRAIGTFASDFEALGDLMIKEYTPGMEALQKQARKELVAELEAKLKERKGAKP